SATPGLGEGDHNTTDTPASRDGILGSRTSRAFGKTPLLASRLPHPRTPPAPNSAESRGAYRYSRGSRRDLPRSRRSLASLRRLDAHFNRLVVGSIARRSTHLPSSSAFAAVVSGTRSSLQSRRGPAAPFDTL